MTEIAPDSERTLCAVLRPHAEADLHREFSEAGLEVLDQAGFTQQQLADVGVPAAPGADTTTVYILSRAEAVDCVLELIALAEGDSNRLWGSPSPASAASAIAALFPSERQVSPAIQRELDRLEQAESETAHPAEPGPAPAREPQPGSAVESAAPSSKFVARPVPATHAKPSSQPRMTKTAALRLGISLPPSTPRTSTTTASDAGSASAKPRLPVTPKSLAAPSIAPRATLTSSRRTTASAAEDGPLVREKAVPRAALSTAERNAQAKAARRHSVQVASTAPPKVEVRLSRTAMLRTGVAPPQAAASHRRSQSASTSSTSAESKLSANTQPRTPVKASAPPKIAVRLTKTAALRTGAAVEERQPSAAARAAVSYEGVPGHKRRESVPVTATSQPPKIAPRLNRSTMLRQSAGAAVEQPARPGSAVKRPSVVQGKQSSRGATPLGERVNAA